jgi:NAD(P)-dependent dehydrogenase (short-subunit alcohol dehydrogenase family)
VRGLLFTVQKALPLISDGGAIVLISSIAAFKGIPKYTSYSATKAAVRSFVRTWTAELKDRGIRVNAISPGAIDTPIIDAQSATKEGADAIRASFKAATPLSRLGRPEEIAAAALFLASDESSYVAGADLVVDGGLSAL